MIHKDLLNFNFEELNSYKPLITIGDLNERISDNILSYNIIKNNSVSISIKLNDNSKILDLLSKYERFTISFIKSDLYNKLDFNNLWKDLTLIYDSDTFVSYIKESQIVMKLKIIERNGNDVIAQITSFLGKENED